MILNFIGAMMVLIAASVLGFMKAGKYRERIREVRCLQAAFNMLSSEISYTATPVPTAFKKIGSRIDEPISHFFLKSSELLEVNFEEDFSAIWRRVVKDHIHETELLKSDEDLLLSISSFMGVSDQQHQEKQIKLILHQLHQSEEDALDAMHKNEKMWRYLGVMGGLMLIILLY